MPSKLGQSWLVLLYSIVLLFKYSSRQITGKNEYYATGGGAIKYAQLLREKLGAEPTKMDEIECVVRGCNFLLNHIPDEAFSFQKEEDDFKRVFHPNSKTGEFPYLLVNIGSGVSIICIHGNGKWERVGGTAMGGGTFWGLGRLLTGVANFDELLAMAEAGSREGVDTLVKDIYGFGLILTIKMAPLITTLKPGQITR